MGVSNDYFNFFGKLLQQTQVSCTTHICRSELSLGSNAVSLGAMFAPLPYAIPLQEQVFPKELETLVQLLFLLLPSTEQTLNVAHFGQDGLRLLQAVASSFEVLHGVSKPVTNKELEALFLKKKCYCNTVKNKLLTIKHIFISFLVITKPETYWVRVLTPACLLAMICRSW